MIPLSELLEGAAPHPSNIARRLSERPNVARLLKPKLVAIALTDKPAGRHWNPSAKAEVAIELVARQLVADESPDELLRALGDPVVTLPRLEPTREADRVESTIRSFQNSVTAAAAEATKGSIAARALERALQLVAVPNPDALHSHFPLLVYLERAEAPEWLAEALVCDAAAQPHLRLDAPRVTARGGTTLGGSVELSARQAMDVVNTAEGGGVRRPGYSPLELDLHGVVAPVEGPSFGLALLAVFGLAVRHRRPLPRTIGLTGEITSDGRVVPVGGIVEKARAAYREGVRLLLVAAEDAKLLASDDRAPPLRVEGVRPDVAGEDLLVEVESLIEKHFRRSLRYSDSALRSEYHRIEERVWDHAYTSLNIARLAFLKRHARRFPSSDFHATLAACCDWALGYVRHHDGQVGRAQFLWGRGERVFAELQSKRRLDPIGLTPWLEVENLRGILLKPLFEHRGARRRLRHSLRLKTNTESPLSAVARRGSIGATFGSLGQVEAGAGNFQRAQDWQRRALKVVPRDERNRQRNYLGALYAAWGRWEKGEKVLARVIADDEGAPPEDGARRSNADFAYLNRMILRCWHGDAEVLERRPGRAFFEAALADAEVADARRHDDFEATIARTRGAADRGLGVELGDASRLEHGRTQLKRSEELLRTRLRGWETKPHEYRGELLATLVERLRLERAAGGDSSPMLQAIDRELGFLRKGAQPFCAIARARLASGSDADLFELVRMLLR